MPFSGIADSEQLTILTAVLKDHCRANGIDPASPECADIGRVLMALFNNGARSVEELKAALAATSARNESRQFRVG